MPSVIWKNNTSSSQPEISRKHWKGCGLGRWKKTRCKVISWNSLVFQCSSKSSPGAKSCRKKPWSCIRRKYCKSLVKVLGVRKLIYLTFMMKLHPPLLLHPFNPTTAFACACLYVTRIQSTRIIGTCAMVKSRYIGDGHPTFNRNPYNGYINPYYWVDDHPLLYGNNGSLDPGTHEPVSS